MHPIYGSFYNRNTANINMGFDNYWNYENKFSEITPSFITDYYLFDYIIENSAVYQICYTLSHLLGC